MLEDIRAALVRAGVDVDGALERFMNNEGLLERFLKKFPADPNYGALKEALARGDADAAFRAAHTLKGVAANLSMATLQQRVSEQVERLRAGDLEGAARLMPGIDESYGQIAEALKGWD